MHLSSRPLHYPCKHVLKVISMTTGKPAPDIIMALGTWAGTEMGGLDQLQSTDDAMAQLKDNFMLSDAEVEKAHSDSTGKAAETETADKADSTAVVADSSAKSQLRWQCQMKSWRSFSKGSSLLQQHSQQCGTNWSATCGWRGP